MKKKASDSNLLKKNRIPTTKSIIKFFMIFFAANIFVCICLAAASGGDSWRTMLFHNGKYTDLFMDFFNSIRDGGSENVYSERNNIYPPLCVLIFRLFSKMISPQLVASVFSLRTLLQIDRISMMIYLLFALICILSMLRLIETYANMKNMGKMKTEAAIISFAMIISYPVMFCLERGNILILSVILAMFFVFFKDSENPVIRELSYIALAVSAGIKIYPAVFGLALIIDKKYKDALRLMFYGIVIVVGPIVFFLDSGTSAAQIAPESAGLLKMNLMAITDAAEGSTSLITKLLENLLSFATSKKSSLNLSSVSIQNFVFLFDSSKQTLAKTLCGITEVLAVVFAFFSKRAWQKNFFLCYAILNIPSASSSYALSFLIIPFCIFLFGNESFKKKDWLYASCFALLLTPLPTLWYYRPEGMMKFFELIGVSYNPHLNQDIGTLVFQFMFFFIIGECIGCMVKSRKQKAAALPEEAKEEGAA